VTWVKEALRRALAARTGGEADGLVLDAPRWQLEEVPPDASRFIGALSVLEAPETFLFLEGRAHPQLVRRFLEKHDVPVTPRPALGTVWPRSPCFILTLQRALLQEMAALVDGLASPEVCDHLHVFTRREVLVSGYDAFSAPFFLSAAVPEARVAHLARSMGCAYKACGPAGAG
jgi:hypothetical protein